MANASKALIIAGAVLITIILMSIVIYAFQIIINNAKLESDVQSFAEQTEAFNRYFIYSSNDIDNNRSNGIQIKGSDAYNIIAKVNDINNNEWSLDEIEIILNGSSLSSVPSESSFLEVSAGGNRKDSKKYTYSYSIDLNTGLVSQVRLTSN